MKYISLKNGFLLSSLVIFGCAAHVKNNNPSDKVTVSESKKISDTHVNLSLEYIHNNALDLALDQVNQAISANESNAKAYMVRAITYQLLHENSNAESNFQKSLSLDNSSPYTHVNYANFLCSQESYDEAFVSFNDALNNPLYLSPEVGYYNRGKCYFQRNDLESANENLLQSISYKHVPQDSYILLARINYKQYKYTDANSYMDKYSGVQTPATLWLHIQILQALVDITQDKNKKKSYENNEKLLAKVLVTDFRSSVEANEYIALDGKQMVSSGSSLAKAEKVIEENEEKDDSVNNSKMVMETEKNGRRYITISPHNTLYSISKAYDVSIIKLKKINRLSSNNILIGSKLYLDSK
ncbi:MAG: LysM peptidoglycan-binding domain-containing protein [Burkholderiales bacterium]|nr:LysM peptidoglycan-binding domain-containing protein [Burkholderiales bacterium]